MSGGWIELERGNAFAAAPGIVLGRNMARVDWDDHHMNGWRGADDRYQHAIVATDTGGHKHVLWISQTRPFMEHFSDEAKAEAHGMLRQIADQFTNDRTGAL